MQQLPLLHKATAETVIKLYLFTPKKFLQIFELIKKAQGVVSPLSCRVIAL